MENLPRNIDQLDEQLILYKKCKDERKKHLIYLGIVEAAMEFVKKIAGGVAVQCGIPNEDLVQVGSIGLIKAPRELQELVAKISTAVKDLKVNGYDEPTED